jgi:hypothetical protein
MALRGSGLQPESHEVALPDRRLQARQPLGEGRPPASAHLRETLRWGKLYAGRSAPECASGRLKERVGALPLRVRGVERVQLHADLTMLATLACALARARAVALAA